MPPALAHRAPTVPLLPTITVAFDALTPAAVDLLLSKINAEIARAETAKETVHPHFPKAKLRLLQRKAADPQAVGKITLPEKILTADSVTAINAKVATEKTAAETKLRALDPYIKQTEDRLAAYVTAKGIKLS